MSMPAWLARAVPALAAGAVTLAAAAATLMSTVQEAAPERPTSDSLRDVIFAPPLDAASPQNAVCRNCGSTPAPRSL